MASVNGITISATTITNCYKEYYPETYAIIQENLFDYLHLWGIRVSTCDTSIPDDLVGGLHVNNLNFAEIVVSKASTEPSPKTIVKLHDQEAIMKGGAAFIKEGQYTYYYVGTGHRKWKPLPAFCPTRPVTVWRWKPTQAEIKRWNGGKGVPISDLFESAVKTGLAKTSTSSDTCIHRAWSKEKLWADSAGCQVLTDDESLRTLGKWANAHINKKYKNIFTYTLFTAEQFVKANKFPSRGKVTGGTTKSTSQSKSFWDTFLSNIFK